MSHTPYLRLDPEVLQRNLAAMASRSAAAGLALRPHAKTHKCLEIARLQLAASASGLTVATIGEAEAFAADGADDLFIAYPLWADAGDAVRLRRLADLGVRLRVGCDSAAAGANLTGLPVQVLVEIDSGHHRSGVPAAGAGDLAAALAGLGLDVAGVFTFPGHGYSPQGGREAASDEARSLAIGIETMSAAGVEPRVVSGGSTPTAAHAGRPLTELRPGVYVFGDAQQLELGTIGFDQVALSVAARVVSHAGGRVIVDAGSKALGADRAPWASGFGRVLDEPDARIAALSEHHATIAWPGALPALGSTVLVVPNHVCNAVNLAEEFVLTSGERWAVAARGRNS